MMMETQGVLDEGFMGDTGFEPVTFTVCRNQKTREKEKCRR
jgi:hypothetical protein